MSAWAVLVTNGTTFEYPPELYSSRDLAVHEAKRWTQTLMHRGGARVGGEDPVWSVGELTIRLVGVPSPSPSARVPWVGTFWTADGVPDPEALILSDRHAALAWVCEPPLGFEPALDVSEDEWFVSCTYIDRGEEAYAFAAPAKVVGAALTNVPAGGALVLYDVEIAVSRLQRIEARLYGPAGLTEAGIEDLVEEDWRSVAAQVSEDTIVSWELMGYSGADTPGP